MQLAHLAGLTVVADAKDEDASLVRSLGADHLVPRGDGLVAAVQGLFPDGVDGLIEPARIGPAAAGLVRDGGTAISVRSTDAGDPRLRSQFVLVGERMADTAALRRLGDLVDAGRLTPESQSVCQWIVPGHPSAGGGRRRP